MNISQTSLEKLKCARCHLYLSVGPITKGLNNNFLCGRCSQDGPSVTIYEALAENFNFPCRYQSFGCQEMIKWGCVEKHEQNCLKKPHFCAAIPPGICLWRGAIHDMVEHFKENHKEDLADSHVITIELNESLEECKLLTIAKRYYIFHVYFNNDQQVLKLNFMQLSCFKTETYQMILYSPGFSKRITLAADYVQPYTSMDHNKIKDDNVIDMGVLKFLLEDQFTISCEVILLEEEQEKNNVDLSQLLECPICNECLDIPIFECKTGHSFCSSCTSKLKNCPFCNQDITEIRNYALESIVSQILLECKNKNLGCTFSGQTDCMVKHEKICKFYTCPLQGSQSCSWNGSYEELIHHCKINHVYLETESYGLVCSLTSDNSGIFRLIYFNGAFLKICRKYDNGEFCIGVQFVGPAERAADYFYEFSFAKVADNRSNISIKNACHTLTDDKNAFDNCLKLPYGLLDMFVKNSKLNCTVKITKKQDVLIL